MDEVKEKSRHPSRHSNQEQRRHPEGGGRQPFRPKHGGRKMLSSDVPIYSERQLARLKVSELQSIAKIEGVRQFWLTPRKRLIVEIVKQQLRRGAHVDALGVLELTPENHGFLRSLQNNLIAQNSDPFIPVQLIREHKLYGGLLVSGHLRQPRSGDKHLVINKILDVEGSNFDEFKKRTPFEYLTALFPEDRLFMEISDQPEPDMTRRVIDLVTPIGKGQRGIIVAPPRVGKTILMKKMVQSIEANHKDVQVIVLLIDERPEEVTDMQESIRGQVIASTFDENPKRHIQVADTALSRAKVLVENGKDVVLFLDSITRLTRAYNSTSSSRGKTMSGGVESAALQKTKQFFGAARNIEGGGSLTIFGTALIQTGSRMDQVIFEEFKGTGNMELYLDREIASNRIYPAVNIQLSGTRKDELLMPPEEYELVSRMRNTLGNMAPLEAIGSLIKQLKKYRSNAEFLMAIKNSISS